MRNLKLKFKRIERGMSQTELAQRAGVDAVILRDLGLYSVLRRLLPDLLLNNYEFVTVSELIHSK